MHGFRVTPQGNPLDDYGRNLFVDTLDSRYGAGWRRENSFLAQRPNGGVLLRLLSPRLPACREGDAVPGNRHRPRRRART